MCVHNYANLVKIAENKNYSFILLCTTEAKLDAWYIDRFKVQQHNHSSATNKFGLQERKE